jgi:iron complex transport system substrate-binding protein
VPIPRRRLAGAVLTLTVAAAIAGCGVDADPASTPTASWTFTDDVGRTVTLDEQPTRVAGQNDVVSSL